MLTTFTKHAHALLHTLLRLPALLKSGLSQVSADGGLRARYSSELERVKKEKAQRQSVVKR